MAEREQISLTIVLEPIEDGWYAARVEEYPEVITGGPTRDEAQLMALDAVREYLASCLETGQPPVTRPAARSAG